MPDTGLSVGGFRRGLLDHFHVDGDVDVVSDDDTTIVHGGVPLDAEVLAVDFCRGGGGGALIAPGVFHGSGRPLHVENDFLGGATNGQITGDFEFAGSNLLDLLGF